MATPYDLIEGTRPRIRRDVLFTQSPSGVLFHNANGGFNVSGASAYRFASLIVPHLDGSRRVAELCTGLGPKQRDMVVNLVRTLYDRGFARDVPPQDTDPTLLPAQVAERFAPQIDYIDHYVGGAAERFARFRGSRVAVLGDDPVARWCVLSLVRNGAAEIAVEAGIAASPGDFAQVRTEAEELRQQGCACEISELPGDGPIGWPQLESRDLVLVTGPDAPLRVLALVEAGVPDGVKLLAAWTFGEHAVIGPLMSAGTAGCFVCAALRLGTNGDAAAAADLWSAAALPGSSAAPRTLTGPLAGMVGNLLAYEVFRARTGALPAETAGRLIVQDLDSLDTWSEPLYPHPRCPHCAPAAANEPEAREPWIPVEAAATEAAATEAAAEQSGTDAVALEDPAAVLAQLEAVSVLVQKRAGVFRAFGDEGWNQTPIKIGTVHLGLGHGGRREVTAFDLHHVAGARIRALHAAARVYTDHVVPVGAVLRGADFELAREKWPVIEPGRLAVASGTVADGARVDAWARALRLDSRETVLVPAAALRTLGPDNSSLICVPTGAGTGTGGSRADAVADGLLSALAMDAVVGAVRGRVPVRLVEPKLLEADAELLFLAKSARNLGVEVELLDVGDPDERPAPVLFARTVSSEDGEPRWAVGSAARWQEAAVAALRDLLGAIQLDRQLAGRPGDAARVDAGDALLGDLDPRALAVDGEAGPGPDAPTAWAEIQRRVNAAGDDVLVAPVDAPDLASGGISVAKVLLVRGNADER